MTRIADLIEQFYGDVWQSGDVAVADEILHPDLRFRGSIGEEKRGHEGFWEYFNLIRGAFGGYRCDILRLLPFGDEAAVKMRFSGMHRRAFMGVEPSGRDISWLGTAFFQMRDDMLSDIWVLGDTDGLRSALAGAPAPHQVDVYWSLQSPYCYLLLPRLEELAARADVDVNIRPVRPGVVRIPDLFKGRSDAARTYFDDDVARTAAFLEMPIGRPDPSPVSFKPGSWQAEVNHDLMHRAYGYFVAASEAGEAMDFVSHVMRRIWDGSTTGWDQTLPEDYPDLAPDPDWLAKVEANEAAMYAAGHWGVPTMVYRGELLYGQDRFDQLLWRIEENT